MQGDRNINQYFLSVYLGTVGIGKAGAIHPRSISVKGCFCPSIFRTDGDHFSPSKPTFHIRIKARGKLFIGHRILRRATTVTCIAAAACFLIATEHQRSRTTSTCVAVLSSQRNASRRTSSKTLAPRIKDLLAALVSIETRTQHHSAWITDLSLRVESSINHPPLIN